MDKRQIVHLILKDQSTGMVCSTGQGLNVCVQETRRVKKELPTGL